MKNKSYQKFALMMAVSFVIMYGVMFLNADIFDHVMLSITRTYMTLLMISAMAVTMMLFMWGMYENKKANYLIIASALIIFVATLTMLRNQTLIADVQWMKAMIPHHSSAIMVSQQAHLKDPEAQQLAQDIIEAQKREIAQMKAMIERIENQD
jgi:uncharacterized protein (DUF305 family)